MYTTEIDKHHRLGSPPTYPPPKDTIQKGEDSPTVPESKRSEMPDV